MGLSRSQPEVDNDSANWNIPPFWHKLNSFFLFPFQRTPFMYAVVLSLCAYAMFMGLLIGIAVFVGLMLAVSVASAETLDEVLARRGLSQADLLAAAKTYTPTGKRDEFIVFSSGGQSGQVIVYGVPSMRILKYIAVFTPEPW